MGRLPDHTCLFQVLCPLELTTETTAHLPREKMITPAPARAGERVSKLRKAKEQRKGSASWNKPRKVRQKKKAGFRTRSTILLDFFKYSGIDIPISQFSTKQKQHFVPMCELCSLPLRQLGLLKWARNPSNCPTGSKPAWQISYPTSVNCSALLWQIYKSAPEQVQEQCKSII